MPQDVPRAAAIEQAVHEVLKDRNGPAERTQQNASDTSADFSGIRCKSSGGPKSRRLSRLGKL